MYPGLNAIRAFAFFGVFLIHVDRLGGGYLGVIAFFVLSGFLITPILVSMRATLPARDYFVRFYGRRTLRIFPLYFLYLMGAGLLASIALYQWGEFSGHAEARNFLSQLPWAFAFLMDFLHASAGYETTPLVSHFWSLAVEEQFYLLWPLVIFATPPRFLKVVLLACAVAGPLMRLAIGADLAVEYIPSLNPDFVTRVYFLPFSHIDAFALGGYFALFGKSRDAGSVLLAAVIVFGVGALTTSLAVHAIYPTSFGFGSHMRFAYQHVWGYSLVNIFFAYAIVHVRDRRFLPFIFENRVLDYLGRISYGLYVYHLGVIYIVNNALSGAPELIRVSLSLGLSIGISAASYEFFEKRFTALKDVYFEKRPAGDDVCGEGNSAPVRVSG